MAISRCAADSTLKIKCGPPMNASALRASSRMLHRISGGASETEAKELMVMPSRFPESDTVLTRHTPVGKVPSDWRNARASEDCGTSPVISVQEYMQFLGEFLVLALGLEAEQVLTHHRGDRVPVQGDVPRDGIRVAPHALNRLIERQTVAAHSRK